MKIKRLMFTKKFKNDSTRKTEALSEKTTEKNFRYEVLCIANAVIVLSLPVGQPGVLKNTLTTVALPVDALAVLPNRV